MPNLEKEKPAGNLTSHCHGHKVARVHRTIAAERFKKRQALLRCDPAETKAEGRAKGFIGETLPAGSKLWSKTGWMSQARHDCAAFELADGRKFVLVIFPVSHANEPEIL